MAGTVSFAGIGSGMDVEGLISSLTQIQEQPISQEKSKAAGYRAAESSFSDVGNLLSKLKIATSALSTAQQVGSYKASSSSSGITVTANGSAQPGAYDVQVEQLAQEQRTYSNTFSANALGLSGTLNLGVGTTSAQVKVDATDTVNTIADKINGAGLRISASVFYDGSQYRLQIRGLDTGDGNDLTFGAKGGIGDQLGLLDPDNTKQSAQSAKVKIDGYEVTSTTNQITGAIPGVTMALTDKTASGTVTIDQDAQGLGTKIQAVVDAYNAVVTQVHTLAGYGQTTAQNPALQGDSSMRSIASRLSSVLTQAVGNGTFQSLGALGVNLANDGTLSLDQGKLTAALQKDPTAVSNVLAGTDAVGSTSGTDGIMDLLGKAVDALNDPNGGVIQSAHDSWDSRAKSLEDNISKEEDRVTAYGDQLRKTFTAMDTAVAAYKAQLTQLGGG
ncbi:MAG TPA: flagellar filament capping protein FliD [Polyangiaceae bacterium]|nr:flagellar filament capping protein FliD [Polyangiaceae bacterium]